MFIGFTAIPFFATSANPDTALKVMILIGTLLLLYYSTILYYFELNSEYFRIKSQLKFWKSITYRTTDIEEVVFETNGKAPHSLKLILKDYRFKKYSAATLSDKTWNQLQRDLEKLNIKVRNEI
jgi:hypothetical protein